MKTQLKCQNKIIKNGVSSQCGQTLPIRLSNEIDTMALGILDSECTTIFCRKCKQNTAIIPTVINKVQRTFLAN